MFLCPKDFILQTNNNFSLQGELFGFLGVNGAGKTTTIVHLLSPKDIYYFESVDQHTFAYCEKEIFEVKSKLYELEAELPPLDFLRSSKSTILNLNKIKSLTPAFGSRFEALLKNGERVIISRQYVSTLKEKLGL